MRTSRLVAISTLPSVTALGLFYSLAIHMHRSLGGWPTAIGEAGFPPALLIHATIATSYFWFLAIGSFVALPISILFSLLVSGLRHIVPYLALHAFSFVVTVMLMQLAPEAYLYWWRD